MKFVPRKLLFKAWNQETGFMMRLNSIDCVRGELFRKNHILLQFTGLYDQQKEEIYEMDMILIGANKFVVCWDTALNGWSLTGFPGAETSKPFVKALSESSIRICNYFESDRTA